MLSPRIRQFLRLQYIVTTLTGTFLGLLISVFSDWLSEQRATLLPWLVGLTLIFGLISIIFFLRKPLGVGVAIRSPCTIRSAVEAERYARRGFVGFVPLYTPRRGTAAAALSPAERTEAVEALDFDRLQPEESNLQPTLEAILSHASQLEHCWLLATRGREAPGSSLYAPVLAEYLRRRKGLKCQFYYGEVYTISLDDDALLLSKTYDQVQQVFRQAARLNLAPQEIVADITSGVRSMALGMILACLSGDQDVEFVGTHYDEQGQPVGDLFPIIFSFEPALE